MTAPWLRHRLTFRERIFWPRFLNPWGHGRLRLRLIMMRHHARTLVPRIARPESLAIGIARRRIAAQTATRVPTAGTSHRCPKKTVFFSVASQANIAGFSQELPWQNDYYSCVTQGAFTLLVKKSFRIASDP